MTGKVIPITGSTFIAGVGYDPDSQVLTLEFTDGKSYAYDAVDENTAQELMSAASKGQFFHARIKGQYPSRRA